MFTDRVYQDETISVMVRMIRGDESLNVYVPAAVDFEDYMRIVTDREFARALVSPVVNEWMRRNPGFTWVLHPFLAGAMFSSPRVRAFRTTTVITGKEHKWVTVQLLNRSFDADPVKPDGLNKETQETKSSAAIKRKAEEADIQSTHNNKVAKLASQ